MDKHHQRCRNLHRLKYVSFRNYDHVRRGTHTGNNNTDRHAHETHTEVDKQRPHIKLLISSLNALVQSAGFSLKRQPRLLLLPISFHGLATATVSSWVHLILSSNLSRKFRTLLQDLFSWHPVTTTQHFSWKNCTGFPFQNVFSIKSLVCVSVL